MIPRDLWMKLLFMRSVQAPKVAKPGQSPIANDGIEFPHHLTVYDCLYNCGLHCLQEYLWANAHDVLPALLQKVLHVGKI